MIQIIHPGCRSGQVNAPLSKSNFHRQLICAALSDSQSSLIYDHLSDDIQATIQCLQALGARIQKIHSNQLMITPIKNPSFEHPINLDCQESGSTLRFLLPITAALGITARFLLKGNLSNRPIQPLLDVLAENGVIISKEEDMISLSGQLNAGVFSLPGNISSQFISGLLFALPLLNDESKIIITEEIESKPYIAMTENHLHQAGIYFTKERDGYIIPGMQRYRVSGLHTIEKDWSNAANFLCMGALSPKGITVKGLDLNSSQGDKKILDILRKFGANLSIHDNEITVNKEHLMGQTIDAKNIPDLIPAISVLAACSKGITEIKNAQRLKLKESNRLKSTCEMLTTLGAEIHETKDGLMIHGKETIMGGSCHCSNDHRIAMAAAIASCHANKDVVIMDAECVTKSYPHFWEDFHLLMNN